MAPLSFRRRVMDDTQRQNNCHRHLLSAFAHRFDANNEVS
jgi:hypothetical protein